MVGFCAGAVIVGGVIVGGRANVVLPTPPREDALVTPGYLKLAAELREEIKNIKERLYKEIRSPEIRFINGWAEGPAATPIYVSIQEQIDKLYSHLGLTLEYVAGKEADVKLVKQKKK